MPANVFELFMGQHQPLEEVIANVNDVLWNRTALNPVIKERVRIVLAEAIGCSYCQRVRIEDSSGNRFIDGDSGLSDSERQQAEVAVAFATEIVTTSGGVDDAVTMRAQESFSPAEFSDLVFAISWFIGTQHIGRCMHWDNACPVAPIRSMVEAGEAA